MQHRVLMSFQQRCSDRSMSLTLALAKRLVAALQPGMLCLADRGFTAHPLFAPAGAVGRSDEGLVAPRPAMMPAMKVP